MSKSKKPKRSKDPKIKDRYVVSYGEMGCQEILDTKTGRTVDGVSDADIINSLLRELNRLNRLNQMLVTQSDAVADQYKVYVKDLSAGRMDSISKDRYLLSRLCAGLTLATEMVELSDKQAK